MRCLNMLVMSSSFYLKARDYSGIRLMPPAAASKRGEVSGGTPNPGREASRLPAPSAEYRALVKLDRRLTTLCQGQARAEQLPGCYARRIAQRQLPLAHS